MSAAQAPPVAADTRWAATLSGERSSAAVTAALDVAARLTDAELVARANAEAGRQTQFPETVHWEPSGVAQGDAGLALFFGYVDDCFPGNGWDAVAHRYLTAAARGAERGGPLPLGIYGGLSGLAFAGTRLSRGGTRYQRLGATLDAALAPQAAAAAAGLSQQGAGVPVASFDVIAGLAGVGAYLLERRGLPAPALALERVLTSLVELTGEDDGLPRWYTPPRFLADEETAAQYPNGNLNCGLAHGIPGPLALMALAVHRGAAVEGLEEAVARVASWLVENRADDVWGPNWPTAVPIGAPQREWPSRSAWCYGSPGVARSLWLAGRALGQRSLRDLAVEAMAAVYRRPIAERRIDSPTFCHGVAGLLQITLRFGNDTGEPLFATAAEALTDQLAVAYDPESLLGFCSLEPGGCRVDQPGLLDGSPGVALALLAAATDVEPRWDRLFLLS